MTVSFAMCFQTFLNTSPLIGSSRKNENPCAPSYTFFLLVHFFSASSKLPFLDLKDLCTAPLPKALPKNKMMFFKKFMKYFISLFPIFIHLIYFTYLFFYNFLGHLKRHMGSYFPDQGWNPGPLQWTGRVLTTGQLGKSLH